MRASFLIFLAGPHGFFDKRDGFSDDADVGAGGAAATEMRNASQCMVTGCGCQLHVSRAASKGPWSAAGGGNHDENGVERIVRSLVVLAGDYTGRREGHRTQIMGDLTSRFHCQDVSAWLLEWKSIEASLNTSARRRQTGLMGEISRC